MKKKIVVLGGGTGMSSLLKGLKEFQVDITAVVSVCDDGMSTGRLRKEFNMPAVGDIRKVLVSLSETEPLVEQLLNYRFKTTSDLNGHAVGNLLLTAMGNMTGNMSDGIEAISKILNLKGKILPLTEDNVTLVAKMTDGTVIEGEHNITESKKTIKKVYYKEKPVVNYAVLEEIKKADLIILSMGSIYTSIIPNLLCKEIVDLLEEIDTPIMYTCNMMTQPGETDEMTVSEHVSIINQYLGKRKIDIVVANNGKIGEAMRKKYETLEQKDPVVLDKENLKDVELITNNYVTIENEYLRHDTILLSLDIFKYLITK
ncbi:MAG: YvcK family protein [Bacilli bacterium]|nr:YvcK family protein [Bacilli bacterium]